MFKWKTLKATIGAAALTAVVTPAAAVTFNFGAGTNTPGQIALGSGLDLTVAGFAQDYDPLNGTGTLGEIAQASTGWGVLGDSAGGHSASDREAGRIGGGEAIVFSFGTEVVLEFLTLFTSVADQSFDLFVDGVKVIDLGDATPNGAGQNDVDLGQTPLTGSVFAVVGLNAGALAQGIRVSSLTATSVAPVPLPAGAALLGGALALGGLAGYRRKRKS